MNWFHSTLPERFQLISSLHVFYIFSSVLLFFYQLVGMVLFLKLISNLPQCFYNLARAQTFFRGVANCAHSRSTLLKNKNVWKSFVLSHSPCIRITANIVNYSILYFVKVFFRCYLIPKLRFSKKLVVDTWKQLVSCS